MHNRFASKEIVKEPKTAVVPRPGLGKAIYVLVTLLKNGKLVEPADRFVFSRAVWSRIYQIFYQQSEENDTEFFTRKYFRPDDLEDRISEDERINVDDEYRFIKLATGKYRHSMVSHWKVVDYILDSFAEKDNADITEAEGLYLEHAIKYRNKN